jgi:hypothetical protein
MDDESLKQRFQQIEKTLAATDKRVDEAKLYAGGIAGLFTVWFAVLSLVLSWNYNNDRASLRERQKDLREDLGKSGKLPNLELVGRDNKPLEGQELEASFETATENSDQPSAQTTMPSIHITFALKNSGDDTTCPMTSVLYTGDAVALSARSIASFSSGSART